MAAVRFVYDSPLAKCAEGIGVRAVSLLVWSARKHEVLPLRLSFLRERQAPVGMTIYEWNTATVKLL